MNSFMVFTTGQRLQLLYVHNHSDVGAPSLIKVGLRPSIPISHPNHTKVPRGVALAHDEG